MPHLKVASIIFLCNVIWRAGCILVCTYSFSRNCHDICRSNLVAFSGRTDEDNGFDTQCAGAAVRWNVSAMFAQERELDERRAQILYTMSWKRLCGQTSVQYLCKRDSYTREGRRYSTACPESCYYGCRVKLQCNVSATEIATGGRGANIIQGVVKVALPRICSLSRETVFANRCLGDVTCALKVVNSNLNNFYSCSLSHSAGSE